MPRVRSTWLVGSVEALPLQAFTIDAVPSEITAGSYYLVADDTAVSLLAQLAGPGPLARWQERLEVA